MPKVIVKTGTTQDGEFELDITTFSWRERAYITEISGTTPPEFARKWFGVDPRTVMATVAVMMQRAGRDPDLDILMDSPDDSITLDYSDLAAEEDEESPPAGAAPSPPGDGTSGETDAEPATSG